MAESKSKPKGQYYSPARFIKAMPGVEHTQYPFVGVDDYVGEAAALEQCGLLRQDMLPKPGSYSICWRPDNDKPQGRESWFSVPGYMKIERQRDGTFLARLTNSREEAARRYAAWKEKDAEECREHHAAMAARRESEAAETRKKETPDSFRAYWVNFFVSIQKVMGAPELGVVGGFTFAGSDEIEARFAEVIDLMRSSEVMPLHPEKAATHGAQEAPPRGNLRLAWSAPEAPAWVADL